MAEWLAGGDRMVTPETALRLSAVYACLRILAETISTLPCVLYRRTGDDSRERAQDHPLYALKWRPNGYQTSSEFIDYMQMQVSGRGVAYAEIVARRGRVDLLPLKPGDVQAELVRGVPAYRVHDGRGARTLMDGEILRVAYMSGPGLQTVSPIAAQAETIGGAMVTADYTKRFFAGGGRPPGYLKHPSHFKNAEARERFRRAWHEQFTGDNAGRTPVLEDGLDYTSIGISNEDAQLLDLRKFGVQEIARIWRIPLVLLGDTEKATSWGTGIEQFMLAFVQHTIRPWLVRWEQALARDLLTDAEREEFYFQFNVDALLRADLLTRYRAYSIGRQWGWLSANDIRSRENENGIGESGDRYLEPTNMHEAGDEPEPPEAPTDEAPDDETEEPEEVQP